MAELYRRLEEYGASDFYPFHMPGHKRNGERAGRALAGVYGLDITEIDGFDNLHQAEDVLKREQERAARIYRAEKTYFLVNGSTGGILSAVCAAVPRGGKLLMARNCHKSVYHGVYLQELEASYLYPGFLEYGISGAVAPEEVERELIGQPDVGAVVVTSPTYEGIVSDIGQIALIAHKYGKPLIVDEAHGAHFGLHGGYPESAVRYGADVVIHSLHKTLPSMTQTALLHVNGNLVNRQRLERYLKIFQTSSPSYVLMASMSNCLEIMEKEGKARLEKLKQGREKLEGLLEGCSFLRILGKNRQGSSAGVSMDGCKLVIGIRGGRLTGWQLYDILRERYHLQMEMAAGSYVLAILSMMDREEGLNRLSEALLEIDEEISRWEAPGDGKSFEREGRMERLMGFMPENETVFPICQAYDMAQEWIPAKEACGRIAGEFINLYPPGIPLAAPGERLGDNMAEWLAAYDSMHLKMQGMENGNVRVLKEKGKQEERK